MKPSYRGIIPLMGALFALFMATGWYFLSLREAEIEKRAHEKLDAVAKQKVEQIARWRAEQLNIAMAIMQFKPLKEATAKYVRKPDAATGAKIVEMLQFICKTRMYEDAQFVTPNGIVQLSPKGVTDWIHEDAIEELGISIRVRKPTLNDIHRHSATSGTMTELVAPLFEGDPAIGNPIGAIVMQVGLQHSIAPMTQTWPNSTRSAEIILVRRDHKDVLILNDLRFKAGSSLQTREPLTQANLPEARAVLGEQGIIRGTDYRGIDVMAALKPIPNSPWFLVAKIDYDEAMEGWRTERYFVAGTLTALSLLLCVALATALLHQAKARQLAKTATALRESESEVQERTRELEENEERFRKLFENSAEPGFLLEDGLIVDCNRAALDALQVISVEQIRKRSLVEFAPPVQPDGSRSADKASAMYARIQPHGSHIFEWECARTNGERFHVEMILTTVVQKTQRLLHASWRDITERRKAEKRFQGIADFNDQLIRAASQGILVYDAAGGCVLANEAAARMVGTTTDVLLQQNFRFIEGWKANKLLLSAERVLATGEPQRHEINYTSSFGKAVWIDGMLTRFFSQGRPHLLATFNDITELKRVASVRQQLSSIIEMTEDFVATATPDGTVCFLNRSARRFLGIGEKDNLTSLRIAAVHTPESAELIAKTGIPTAVRNGTWFGETEIINHRGKAIPHSQVIIAHFSESGAVEMISTIARDQSAQKQMERIMEARIHILEKAAQSTLDEFLTFCLDEIEINTSSKIGFFHFLDSDQNTLLLQAWSSNTLKHMCTAEGKGQHYPVSKAGIWCDSVRFRRPIIHNDYEAMAKPGALPSGHAKLLRELVLPLMRGGKIVAIIGVGNKPFDYDEQDIGVAQILADFAWEIVEKKRVEAEQKELLKKHDGIEATPPCGKGGN